MLHFVKCCVLTPRATVQYEREGTATLSSQRGTFADTNTNSDANISTSSSHEALNSSVETLLQTLLFALNSIFMYIHHRHWTAPTCKKEFSVCSKLTLQIRGNATTRINSQQVSALLIPHVSPCPSQWLYNLLCLWKSELTSSALLSRVDNKSLAHALSSIWAITEQCSHCHRHQMMD